MATTAGSSSCSSCCRRGNGESAEAGGFPGEGGGALSVLLVVTGALGGAAAPSPKKLRGSLGTAFPPVVDAGADPPVADCEAGRSLATPGGVGRISEAGFVSGSAAEEAEAPLASS